MSSELAQHISSRSSAGRLADGSTCRTIAPDDVLRLAAQFGVNGRRVEIEALKQQVVPDRYLRNRRTLSLADQIRLLEASVCVVGLGGLGGLVAETLARMGVGQLRLADGDRFDTHNLNRQLFSRMDRLGCPKAQTAAERLQAINPGLDVTAIGMHLTPENAGSRIAGCQAVVDCLDNIPARFTLQGAAQEAGIPLVSAAVAGLSGHVTTIFPGDRGLETIYGPPDRSTRTTGVEIEVGCLAPGVNLIASLESAEVLKVLLNRKNTLNNRLLLVDLEDYSFELLSLS